MNCEWFQEIFVSFLKGYKTIMSDYRIQRIYPPFPCVHLLMVIFNNLGVFGLWWKYTYCFKAILAWIKIVEDKETFFSIPHEPRLSHKQFCSGFPLYLCHLYPSLLKKFKFYIFFVQEPTLFKKPSLTPLPQNYYQPFSFIYCKIHKT